MKICPSCEEEFIDSIDVCPGCQESLVFELAHKNAPKKEALNKKELLDNETMPLTEGPLPMCRELEKILSKAEIVSAIYPVKENQNENATLGSACAHKYMLLIKPEDLDRCRDVLKSRFEEQVAKEGMGNFNHDVIDLEKEEICCPACNETGPLQEGECRFCGLFLGEAAS